MRTRFFTLVAVLVAVVPVATAQARGSWNWSEHVGADPVETIANLEVSRDAISPRKTDIDLTFHSTTTQALRISVDDEDGETVRTIVDAAIAAGDASYSWDGRDDSGALVADGTYEVVLEAQVGGDSMSVSDYVRVDRRAPTISVPRRTIRLSSRAARSFQLPVVVSENAMLDAVVKGRTAPAAHAIREGRGRMTVPISAARRLLGRGRAAGGEVTVLLRATDAAGNVTSRSVGIEFEPPVETAPEPTTPVDPGPINGSSKLSWPLSGPITSRFGQRWGRLHAGIDLGVPTGRPIAAAAPGRVTYSGWMSGYGNVVIIDHGTIDTLYGHQSHRVARVGQSVSRGQVIGYVGSTGNSTGPHLHFETRVNGVAKDPLRYLP